MTTAAYQSPTATGSTSHVVTVNERIATHDLEIQHGEQQTYISLQPSDLHSSPKSRVRTLLIPMNERKDANAFSFPSSS